MEKYLQRDWSTEVTGKFWDKIMSHWFVHIWFLLIDGIVCWSSIEMLNLLSVYEK